MMIPTAGLYTETLLSNRRHDNYRRQLKNYPEWKSQFGIYTKSEYKDKLRELYSKSDRTDTEKDEIQYLQFISYCKEQSIYSGEDKDFNNLTTIKLKDCFKKDFYTNESQEAKELLSSSATILKKALKITFPLSLIASVAIPDFSALHASVTAIGLSLYASGVNRQFRSIGNVEEKIGYGYHFHQGEFDSATPFNKIATKTACTTAALALTGFAFKQNYQEDNLVASVATGLLGGTLGSVFAVPVVYIISQFYLPAIHGTVGSIRDLWIISASKILPESNEDSVPQTVNDVGFPKINRISRNWNP